MFFGVMIYIHQIVMCACVCKIVGLSLKDYMKRAKEFADTALDTVDVVEAIVEDCKEKKS